MTQITNWQCDICERKFDNQETVRNGLTISFKKNDDTYLEVCKSCIKKIVDMVDNLKPTIKHEV
jgi:hypothetical protein